ncbi:hypothetical protein MY4038_003488 [Beauveria bassiana]
MLGPDDRLLGRSYYFHIPNRVGNTMTDPYPGILAARDETGYLGAGFVRCDAARNIAHEDAMTGLTRGQSQR